MSEKMGEMLTLMQRAEKMEYVNEEIAFHLYIELFENYEPQISKPYESAIRLFEKRDKLQEALNIANKAISLINKNQMTAGAERFTELADRIEKKMKEKGIKPIGTRNKSGQLRSVLIILGMVFLLFAVTLFTTPFGNVFLDFKEKKGVNDGNAEGFIQENHKFKDYPITRKMIDYAVGSAERNEEVLTANIVVEGKTVGIAIVTKNKDAENGKSVLDDTLRALAKAASSEYSDLTPPSESDPGGIYLYYDIVATVGTGVSESSFYLRGTRNAGGKHLLFKEDAEKRTAPSDDVVPAPADSENVTSPPPENP